MASSPSTTEATGVWSAAEHERFLEAIALYPNGPWPLIAAHVGTRSSKKVQTHAQKYQQKLLRHQRGLRKSKSTSKRPEHRVDRTTAEKLQRGSILRHNGRRPSGEDRPASPDRDAQSSSSLPFSLSPLKRKTVSCRYSPSAGWPMKTEHGVPGSPSSSTTGSSSDETDFYEHECEATTFAVDPLPFVAHAGMLPWATPDDGLMREALEVLFP